MGKKNYKRHLGNEFIQIQAMKSKYPNFVCKKKDGEFIFTGDLMIKPELPVYNVSVHYRFNRRPLVYVNNPQLVEHCPHRYSDKSLCLYHSENYKWNADKLIAGNIMQWTIAWCYFYEAWLQTGTWFGPEVPHGNDTSKDIEKEEDK